MMAINQANEYHSGCWQRGGNGKWTGWFANWGRTGLRKGVRRRGTCEIIKKVEEVKEWDDLLNV